MRGHLMNPTLDTGIQAWGDSLTEATSGGIVFTQRWPTIIGTMFSPKRPVNNQGVGGETADQIKTRQLAYIANNTQINIIWAGRNDVGAGILSSITTPIASMVSHVGDNRFVILSIINKTDGSEDSGTNYDFIQTANAALLAAYPNNYLSVINELNDNSLRVDGLHLTAAGNTIVAQKIFDFITLKGW